MKIPVAAVFLAGLLLLLFWGARGAVWNTTNNPSTSGSGGGVADRVANDEHQDRAARNQSIPWTPAKIHSLLNLREGEMAMIRIPPDALEKYFPVVDGDFSSWVEPRLYSPADAAKALEAASRDRSSLAAKLGVMTEPHQWNGGGMDIEIEAAQPVPPALSIFGLIFPNPWEEPAHPSRSSRDTPS